METRKIPGPGQVKCKCKVSLEHLVPGTKSSEINGAMSKGPKSQREMPPLTKFRTVSASRRKMMVMDYNSPNEEKEIKNLWRFEERMGEKRRVLFYSRMIAKKCRRL